MKVVKYFVMLAICAQFEFSDSLSVPRVSNLDDEVSKNSLLALLSYVLDFSPDPSHSTERNQYVRRPLPTEENSSENQLPCRHQSTSSDALRSSVSAASADDHPCNSDLKSLCGDIKPPTTVAETYNARMCLWSHNEQLTPSCMNYLTIESPSVVEPCFHQIKSFCSRVQPGESRVQSCLEENYLDLSVRCAQALHDETVPKEIESDDFGIQSESISSGVLSMLESFDQMMSAFSGPYSALDDFRNENPETSIRTADVNSPNTEINIYTRTTNRNGIVETETTTVTTTKEQAAANDENIGWSMSLLRLIPDFSVVLFSSNDLIAEQQEEVEHSNGQIKSVEAPPLKRRQNLKGAGEMHEENASEAALSLNDAANSDITSQGKAGVENTLKSPAQQIAPFSAATTLASSLVGDFKNFMLNTAASAKSFFL